MWNPCLLFALKFIYSEKATKFCEIFPLLLTVCTVVKSKGKISQNFVAFSEYMNFKTFNARKFISRPSKAKSSSKARKVFENVKQGLKGGQNGPCL